MSVLILNVSIQLHFLKIKYLNREKPLSLKTRHWERIKEIIFP